MLEFFKNVKNNIILIMFVLILALIGLFFWQKMRADNFKNKYEAQVQETKRIQNNYDASIDTIKTYKDKNGNLTGEIMAFKFKNEELDSLYKKYFSLYVKEKNKEPKVVIQTEYVVVNNIKAKTVVTDSTIFYKDSIPYKNGNWTLIEGKIPYSISEHIKKGKSVEYAFNKSVLYCYNLQQRGMKEARVVAFTTTPETKTKTTTNQNREITVQQAFQDTNSFFRIYLTQSTTDIRDQIVYLTGLDKSFIDNVYYDGLYTYYTGVIIPNKDIEPMVEAKELLIYPKLWTGINELQTKDVMTLYTGLYKDEKTGKLMIQVKTDHPGVTFREIRGAEILSDDKKVSRAVRKEFGLGLNIGVAGMLTPDNNNWSIKFGPVISIGLNYTPRWLQFGPSSNIIEKEK